MKTLTLVSLLVIAINPGNLYAAILFESGTLGPTGINLSYGEAPGTFVKDSVFVGVRFEIGQRAQTTHVGGHFAAVDGGGFGNGGTFFGALIKLNGEDDFPDSDNLSTPDVLGATVLTFPIFSDEVFGELAVQLDSGWYALVFGSHLFGATGHGGAVRNGLDIGDPSYIGFGPNLDWFNLDIFQTFFDNHRFVVKGISVPEPSMGGLCLLLFVGFGPLRRAR